MHDTLERQELTADEIAGYYEYILREAVRLSRQIMTPMEIRKTVNDELERNENG